MKHVQHCLVFNKQGTRGCGAAKMEGRAAGIFSVEKFLSVKRKMPASIRIKHCCCGCHFKDQLFASTESCTKSHNIAKIMFDLEQPFLICYYSLSWGIDHGIIAAPFASDCVFPFIFFHRQLSASWIIMSNFMSLRFRL